MYNGDLKAIAQMEDEYAGGSRSSTITDRHSLENCDGCDGILHRDSADDTGDHSVDYYEEDDAPRSRGKLS
jgi:hypothetical protein